MTVVALDELGYSPTHLLDALERSSVDGLFSQVPNEAIGDPFGFWLLEKDKAGCHADALISLYDMIDEALEELNKIVLDAYRQLKERELAA